MADGFVDIDTLATGDGVSASAPGSRARSAALMITTEAHESRLQSSYNAALRSLRDGSHAQARGGFDAPHATSRWKG
jgi:hypothetical protein